MLALRHSGAPQFPSLPHPVVCVAGRTPSSLSHYCCLFKVKESKNRKSYMLQQVRAWCACGDGRKRGRTASLAALLHRLFHPGGSEHRGRWMRSALQHVASRPHVAVGRRPVKRRRLAYAPSPLQMFSLPKSNLHFPYARKNIRVAAPVAATAASAARGETPARNWPLRATFHATPG